jgi:hypothetical protein
MFDDYEWREGRTEAQHVRYQQWRRSVPHRRLIVIELGAGSAIPTVRIECEATGQTLIRINPRESEVSAGGIGLPLGALEALSRLDALL